MCEKQQPANVFRCPANKFVYITVGGACASALLREAQIIIAAVCCRRRHYWTRLSVIEKVITFECVISAACVQYFTDPIADGSFNYLHYYSRSMAGQIWSECRKNAISRSVQHSKLFMFSLFAVTLQLKHFTPRALQLIFFQQNQGYSTFVDYINAWTHIQLMFSLKFARSICVGAL
jgi:hypothetical protein